MIPLRSRAIGRLARATAAALCLSSLASAQVSNGSNLCASAPAISGPGFFAFNNTTATTDGRNHFFCDTSGDPQVWRDLWWKWTATCDGPVVVQTCNLTNANLNTELVVYAPQSPCPPTDTFVIGCNDDACGLQSSVLFVAIAGQEYTIRLGVFGNGPGGAGNFRITCLNSRVCTGLQTICRGVNLSAPAHVSGPDARVADRFWVEASGFVSELCWRGGDSEDEDDSFRVTYWTNVNGIPGTRIADFNEGSGTLLVRSTLTGGTLPGMFERDYSASHAPVPLAAKQSYWVEIRNTGSRTWAWAAGQGDDGLSINDTSPSSGWPQPSAIGDRALCLAYKTSCVVDTNADGVIDFADLNNILSAINTPCP